MLSGLRDAFRELRIPVLLVFGSEDDYGCEATAEHFAELFGDARILAIPRSGHTPHDEDRAAWNEAVSEFLAFVARRSGC